MQSSATVLKVLASADQATVRPSVVLAALLALSVVIRPGIAWGMLGIPSSDTIPGDRVGIAQVPAVFFIARTALVGLAVLALCIVGRGEGSAAENVLARALFAPWAMSLAVALVEIYSGSPSVVMESTPHVAAGTSATGAVDLRYDKMK
jgi:hypothetical protein